MTQQHHSSLEPNLSGLLVVDMQEKLLSHIDRSEQIIHNAAMMIKGFQAFDLPIVVAEQYPQGLGETVETLREVLAPEQEILEKTAFSCLGDATMRQRILELPVEQWVLVGIEAHVCVLQTARDLMAEGKQVVVLNDAVSSRSIFDFSTAIAELKDYGVRVSCCETVLFELLKDSKAPQFREISALVK